MRSLTHSHLNPLSLGRRAIPLSYAGVRDSKNLTLSTNGEMTQNKATDVLLAVEASLPESQVSIIAHAARAAWARSTEVYCINSGSLRSVRTGGV